MLFYLYSTQQLFSEVPANRSTGEDPKLSSTSAACLRWLGGASPSSAPPQGWWGRRTAKSTWREFNLDLAENLKQTFPEKRAGESHKSTYTAWSPAVPMQPCPQSKGCPATSTPCSEPRRQPSNSRSPAAISSAPQEGSATPAALLYQQPRLLGGPSQSCHRVAEVAPYGCGAGGPEPAHRGAALSPAAGTGHLQSQKIPAKI